MLASSRLTIGTAPSLCRRCHILLTHKSYRNLSPILGPPTSIQTAKLSSCLSQVNSRTSTEKLTQVSHIHRFWSSLHTHRRHLQPGHHSRTAQIYTKSESLPEDLSFENILCDTNRRRVVDFMGSVDPVRTLKMFGVKEGAKVQAVLVPLCLVDGEPSILFTLRSSSLKKHRGEVSFPGGRQDDTDADHVHTALRETFEEIGLHPRHFDVWGTLTPTPGSRARKSPSVVYPVLARYTKHLDLSNLKLSEDEVEEVFTCSIQDLCGASGKVKVGSTQFRTFPGYTLPVYDTPSHRIWGLSAIILHQVLTVLAPGLYTFKVKHVA